MSWYLCPCVQACVQGLELLLLVLALLSGLLGVGWEVQRAEQEQGWDSELPGWKNTGQCLQFAGCPLPPGCL